ncbi:FecR family protein [Marinilabiliaceae bacterium JC040]|nr:FecR family protein [Marinilabiliaceae bacterium JC040]
MTEPIWDIIARIARNEEVSLEEKSLFNSWYDSSNKNKELFKMIKKIEDDKLDYSLDIKKAYYLNQLKIKNKVRQKRFKLYTLIAYAASVLIIFSSFFFLLKDRTYESNIYNTKIAKSQIKVGSKKAILKLADGSVLKLDSISSKEIKTVSKEVSLSNNNSILKYSSKGAKPVKLKYNEIFIPRGGEYQLVLSDGTRVKINSETKIKYPIAFGNKKRIVYLEGEAYFEVSKDAKRPFIVNCNGIKTRVLGTSFNVSSYDNIISTTLVEGSVVVEYKKSQTIKLTPGEQSIYNVSSQSIKKQKVDVDLFVLWKDGTYKFVNEKVENIMKTISRWYNIDVFFANEEVKKIRFTGKVQRYKNISSFIEILEMTHDIRIEVGKGSLLVSKK